MQNYEQHLCMDENSLFENSYKIKSSNKDAYNDRVTTIEPQEIVTTKVLDSFWLILGILLNIKEKL